MKIIHVNELPEEIEDGSVFELSPENQTYFTHSFFKYPCKFIPQIPQWGIKKYTSEKAKILDPFAGSGTTLVEAVLLNRTAYGIDFDKLSQLLCKTKTTLLNRSQIDNINLFVKDIVKSKTCEIITPNLHNLSHWFSDENIHLLSQIKINIEIFYESNKDQAINNFLKVAFAAIIKKASFTDDTSPKPYVSSRIRKNPGNPIVLFNNKINSNLKAMMPYESKKIKKANIISDDARLLKNSKLDNKIDLIITSPPYINAFDYVRSLRLENAWLDYFGDDRIIEIKRKQFGTENVRSNEYKNFSDFLTKSDTLNRILYDLQTLDKKRAFIVWNFFNDMVIHLNEMKKVLKKGSHYIMIIGNSQIRNIDVNSTSIIIELSEHLNFKLTNRFSYLIKNPYLRIPRSGKGGHI
ncbi:MAG: DNA methyltransferase, partial [Melioribacteraceae bacterium]